MNRIYSVLLLCALSVSAFAQPSRKNPKNIEEFKEKRQQMLQDFIQRRNSAITREANLTPEDSAAFFPIYEELQRKKMEINRELHRKIAEADKIPNKSEKEYKALIQNLDELPMKEAEITAQYTKKFEKILSPEQLYRIKLSERKFARNSFAPKQPMRQKSPKRD